MESVAEFLAGWRRVENDGLESLLAARRAEGWTGEDAELDDGFLPALDFFRAELNRLEFEEDVREAMRESKRK